MTAELIFITGATGFIGATTALAALKAGYRLRVSVRKPSAKLQALLSEYSQQVEYVTVPDLTDETAFHGKLNGVDYVLHLASPLPQGKDKNDYFIPAIKGTTALLKEAERVASIKKVVVTSSMAAFIPFTGLPKGGIVKEDNDWDFSVDEDSNFEDPQNPESTAFRLYHASKLLANNAAWSFWQTAKPHYSLVSIHPAYVFGKNLVQTSAEEGIGSNGVLWKPVMTGILGSPASGVHIEDVAEAHVKALSPNIPNGAKYLLAGKRTTWKEVAQIVHRDYPNVGAKISVETEVGSFPLDTSKAEQELGMKWRSWEQMIHEVVDQQLGLINKPTA